MVWLAVLLDTGLRRATRYGSGARASRRGDQDRDERLHRRVTLPVLPVPGRVLAAARVGIRGSSQGQEG